MTTMALEITIHPYSDLEYLCVGKAIFIRQRNEAKAP